MPTATTRPPPRVNRTASFRPPAEPVHSNVRSAPPRRSGRPIPSNRRAPVAVATQPGPLAAPARPPPPPPWASHAARPHPPPAGGDPPRVVQAPGGAGALERQVCPAQEERTADPFHPSSARRDPDPREAL